jgi:hypothetical protein
MNDIKNLVNNNSSLCKFFGNPTTLADFELLTAVLKNPIFTAKLKESLDYYKPRDPSKDINDGTTLNGRPIVPLIREMLSNISNEYVNYIKLESIL